LHVREPIKMAMELTIVAAGKAAARP
jgi:hypothetical protein